MVHLEDRARERERGERERERERERETERERERETERETERERGNALFSNRFMVITAVYNCKLRFIKRIWKSHCLETTVLREVMRSLTLKGNNLLHSFIRNIFIQYILWNYSVKLWKLYILIIYLNWKFSKDRNTLKLDVRKVLGTI